MPGDAVDQDRRLDVDAASELDDGVQTRKASAVLQQPDRGAVHVADQAQLFLGVVGSATGAEQVAAEMVGQVAWVLRRAGHQATSKAAK